MTRIGMNPARGRVSDYKPARVTVAVLVHVPHQSAYFEHRFEVVKLCLASILKNTHEPHDLLVFDNGSSPEVKAYLRELVDRGAVDYLITSHENVGKIGAFKILFAAAPGEVVAFADDDIFFYPGWLKAHLELLDGFPNVGMVSGCAIRTLFDHGLAGNLAYAEREPDVRLIRGQSIPETWERDWAESYGRDIPVHLEAIKSMEDIQIERGDLRAYAIANHNQFVSPKEVILEVLPEGWPGRLMGMMKEMDDDIAERGYLRLSTLERTTRHMGNNISESMAAEAERFGIDVAASKIAPPQGATYGLLRRIVHWKPIFRVLHGLYNQLFWLISEQRGHWIHK